VIAQETLALESLAPGRFRLGIGPAHITNMEHAFGIEFRAPLTNLREYLTIVRTLLREGRVDFDGRHVTAHTSVTHTAEVPVFASALRPKSFEACGELADGAISWMCPRSYLVEQALPAIARGAERAGRAAPPLIMHVPVAVDEDRDRVRTMARDQLGLYGSIPFYQAMFEQAGHADPDKGYSDSLLDDLVVSGSEEQVASGLRALIDAGMGEVIATPILNREDRAGSRARTFAAIALASAG
jgi:alkanesulfonate monooxygenase SsuD/methylene tetrahydromethanopterin reductase-like flavin-dependent oxidoreductase (luciferase family)